MYQKSGAWPMVRCKATWSGVVHYIEGSEKWKVKAMGCPHYDSDD